QAGEDAVAPVAEQGGLAVHRPLRANDPAAEDLTDALVAEADAEQRHRPAEAGDHRVRDPRLVRGAGAGRDDDERRGKARDLGARQGIVARHGPGAAGFADVARQVVGEGVVVVDQKDGHDAPPTPSPACSARAFGRVSSYSATGSESATMPPPVW